MGRPVRIAIAGGGTGGHVFPALGIADAIRAAQHDAAFLFFGTRGKIESTVVPAKGYPFRSIWISGFHRSLRPANLVFPLKLVVSLVQSWIGLRSFRPDVVVGTGGYVCGPVLFVASRMGIPTVLHESNSYPGVTTRMLARKVTVVLTGFPETERWLPNGTAVEVAGTPVRTFDGMPARSEARSAFGFSDTDVVILLTGGSQGSASMNRAVDAGMQKLADAGVQLIWQTGRAEEARLQERHARAPHVRIRGFIDDVAAAYAAADVVVSRAGASTLAELAVLGKPAVLVPYPFAAGDHQMKNAKAIEQQGGALVVPDDETGERLVDQVIHLCRDEIRRASMAASMKRSAQPEAADRIARIVLSQVQQP